MILKSFKTPASHSENPGAVHHVPLRITESILRVGWLRKRSGESSWIKPLMIVLLGWVQRNVRYLIGATAGQAVDAAVEADRVWRSSRDPPHPGKLPSADGAIEPRACVAEQKLAFTYGKVVTVIERQRVASVVVEVSIVIADVAGVCDGLVVGAIDAKCAGVLVFRVKGESGKTAGVPQAGAGLCCCFHRRGNT